MYKFMKRLVIFLFFWVVFFSIIDKVKADTALIYHSSYSDAHTNVKSQLEADGYTVTLSTTGTVHDNLKTNNIDGTSGGYDVVYDMKYNNNIGSNGKDRYQAFIQNGGVLVLVGENQVNYSNTNNTIAAFINNKAGGSMTILGTTGGGDCGNDCNITQTNTDVTDSNYTSVGVYPYGAYFSGDGTWVAKSTSGKVLWMRWSGSELNSGYTGAVYVTFDINQFTSSYDGTQMSNLISDTYSNFLSASTPQAGITSSQQTEVNTIKNKSQTTNQIYLTQSGDGLDLDIVQDGDNNLIIGPDLTNAGSISGTNNEITLTQTNDGNVLGIDVNGNTNDVDIVQNTNQNAIVDITGNSNTLDLEQIHLNNNGEHFSKVTVNGNSNSITIDQKETGNKILFLDVDGSNNVQVDQKGTGNHFLDINLTDSHTVDVTQDGSGSHDAKIHLSGNPSSVTLTQDSSNDQNYYLEQNCSSSSCSATVTQN